MTRKLFVKYNERQRVSIGLIFIIQILNISDPLFFFSIFLPNQPNIDYVLGDGESESALKDRNPYFLYFYLITYFRIMKMELIITIRKYEEKN